MYKVSVIVPVYNVEKYIKQCVDSILNQTYSNMEIILVNDGSLDNSGNICDDYAKNDERVLTVHKPNGGLASARNVGISKATGEYVMFIDSDDWIDVNTLSILVDTIRSENADLVVYGHKKVTDGVHISEKSKINVKEIYSGKENIIKSVLLPIIGPDAHKNIDDEREMSVCMSLYKRKIISENKLSFISENMCLSEDLFFNIDYISKIEKSIILPDMLYYYRYNPQSLSNGYRSNKIELLQKMVVMLDEKLEQLDVKKYSGKRIERAYIKHLRYCLMQVSRSNLSNIDKLTIYKGAAVHDVTQNIVLNFPYKNVPIKEAIMVFLLRQKWSMLLKVYLDMQALIINLRGWRN